ncbi:MAG: DMT family transporter [Desulfovibrionaceae bacterium]|nr:DMT family transporter [Desulfovibrionaceae bacterium]
MQISRRKAIALLLLIVFFWGTTWVAMGALVREITPVWLAAFRYIIALAAVILVQGASGNLTLPRKGDTPIILVVAIFSLTLCSITMATGLQFVPPGRSVVLGYTHSLWVAPGAWLFLREELPPRRLAGVILGISGIITLCDPPAIIHGQGFNPLGYAMLLLNALSFSVAILYTRRHVWVSSPFQVLFWQFLLAAALLSLLALLIEGPPNFSLSPLNILLLLHIGIPGGALAFWAVSVVNSSLPATATSLGILAAPLVGIFFSAIFMNERIDAALIAAVFMILGGILLGNSQKASNNG